MSNSSPMALVNIFVEPKSVFDNLKANKKWAIAGMLLIIGITAVSSVMFFGGMSSSWIVEQQLMAAGDMSPAEREAAREAMTMMADYVGIMAAVSAAIFVPVVSLLFATYYLIIGKTAGGAEPELSFGDWFTFTIWTQMPSIINTLGFMALFLSAATADLPLSMANYASLNQLVFNYGPTDSLYAWAESLNLFAIWSVILAAVGFNRCLKTSMVKSALFAVLPLIVIFGAWFIIAA
ncbi:YIP1 family protein [Psychrobium sp. MM17-31]|uniref:YIP1 family protein n=1 Tax=Psychrobium sp. MM17-31 TaxID=2917758 RepID=UPI001EF45D1B|nr:YIP1 family protein [Psychrobium sp. MM17-31]MCG7532895.1 YIP1 family protein [Psychrobium sp. MM17-31]